MSKNNENQKILILGAGNFGTCLAQHLASVGHKPTLVDRCEKLANSINKEHINPKYLSNFTLHPNIKAEPAMRAELLKLFNFVVIAVPTQIIREAIEPIKNELSSKIIICVSKGIENKSLQLPSEIITSVLGKQVTDNIAYLSGPSFAIEVMEQQPTAVAVTGTNKKTTEVVQKIFHAPHFRAYLNHDPVGAELAGALKNVIAIAAGACEGLGFKSNTTAALITRGLGELTRIGSALGANPLTFKGLTGVGDLVLTCSSAKSRNYRVGFLIAQGKSLKEAQQALGSVAEGVATTKAAYQLAQKYKIRAPIIKAVYQVLYESWDIQKALNELFAASAKHEFE